MTIKILKEIINSLPDETVLLLEGDNYTEVESISVEYHSDGRTHIMFSPLE